MARDMLIQKDHSVNTEIFKPNKIQHKNIRLLFVGRLVEEKGFLMILKFINETSIKNIEFWVVGEGPLSRQLMVDQSNKPNINYLGGINDEFKLAYI
jgi:glycosyltransferase involved in cell wall biosynthesis